MKNNLLVTMADEGYLDQAKQLFSSVYWNAGWKGDYMLLAYKIPDKKLIWFRKKGIRIKKCRQIFNNDNDYRSIMTNKFYMFTPEFKRWNNIVYIDADIMVRAPLDELAKVEGFAAVEESRLKDQFISTPKSEKEDLKIKKLKENYNLNEARFNSGVMAFNTKIINRTVFSELKKLFIMYKTINIFNDQPIINLVFYKRWQKLPLCYNTPPYQLAHPYFIKNIKKIPGIILHFIGKRKPWDKGNPFYEEWKHNLEIADLININKPTNPRALSRHEIRKLSRYIKTRMMFYAPIKVIDRCIGLIGIFLKKF